MPLSQTCVMVVDDQAVMRILILGHLRQLGVEQVHAFGDAASALHALPAARPDLVLTDVQMQPMEGLALVRALRALPDRELSTTPVVFLSGDDSPELHAEGDALGVCGYLAKPTTSAALAELLRQVLGR
ncbi:MAG: response regulator [Rhodoferax sp.]|nr:response regulator [Rhodoferax sp.]